METRKSSLHLMQILVLLVALCLAFATPAFAKDKKSKWSYENGAYHYYKKGVQQKGLVKIDKKTYYLGPDGAQKNGWQKIDGKYYYFEPKNGSKGYLVKNRVVDGITLDSKGRARVTSKAAQDKLKLMAECQQVVSMRCDPKQSMSAKKKTMFYYTMHHYGVCAVPDLSGRADYDVAYAQWLLDNGRGDCYCFGALYTYFLNAIGYADPLFVASGGHAWTELKGKVYDTNWATVMGAKMCYSVPDSLSGVDGRPNWAANRVYVFSVNSAPRG